MYSILMYSILRLIGTPVNWFHRLIGSKQPGPDVIRLSGVDCIDRFVNKDMTSNFMTIPLKLFL